MWNQGITEQLQSWLTQEFGPDYKLELSNDMMSAGVRIIVIKRIHDLQRDVATTFLMSDATIASVSVQELIYMLTDTLRRMVHEVDRVNPYEAEDRAADAAMRKEPVKQRRARTRPTKAAAGQRRKRKRRERSTHAP